jgi:hypothetical protein
MRIAHLPLFATTAMSGAAPGTTGTAILVRMSTTLMAIWSPKCMRCAMDTMRVTAWVRPTPESASFRPVIAALAALEGEGPDAGDYAQRCAAYDMRPQLHS